MKRFALSILLMGLALGTACPAGEYSPSGEFITRANMRSLEPLPNRQVARFLVHPFGPASNAAERVLADRSNDSLPLLLQLLDDNIPGLRAGAMRTLSRIYLYEGEVFRSDVDDELTRVIAAVRPLIDDTDLDVRRAVVAFVMNIRVDNSDTRALLYRVATTQDINTQARLQDLIRNELQDPEFRVELGRQCCETLVAMKSPNPGSLKVFPILASSQLDHCQSMIPACVELIEKHTIELWGMFSNSPSDGAFDILARFPEDPRVRDALPACLKVYTRKASNKHYWDHLQSGPRLIIMRLGPESLPAVQRFLAAEREQFRRFAAGTAAPANSWDTLQHGHQRRFEELEETTEITRALHDKMPTDQAVALICRVYLQRDWTNVERQLMRDRLLALGPAAAPLLERSLQTQRTAARQRVEAQLETYQLQKDAPDTPGKKELHSEIDRLNGHLARYDQLLDDMATLLENAAKAEPDDRAVQALCGVYVRHGQSRLGPASKEEMFGWQTQRALIRKTLLGWGPATASAIRRFVDNDDYLQQRLVDLDAQWEHAHNTLRYGRGLDGEEIRINLERHASRDSYDQLADLALVIEMRAGSRLTADSATQLCRIYTRRGWDEARPAIAAVLTAAQRDIAPVVRKHLKAEKDAMQKVVERKLSLLNNTVKSRVRWQYYLARQEEARLRQGIDGLDELIRKSVP